jgi:flagellar hook-associated protein 2
MSLSTNLVSGLASGFDWRSMIDQLIAIDSRRVDLIGEKKSGYESRLSEWRSVNTMLLSLRSAAEALGTESAFNVFTSSTTSNTSTSASNLLTVSTGSAASPGIYNIKVNNVAQSEKISSRNYSATDTALGLEGDILVSGKVVNIAYTDTLSDIKEKINAVNSGSNPSNVTASIVAYASDNYHLVLTSDNTGEGGLNVLEAAYSGGDDILQSMGFIKSTTTIKTTTTDGAKSDLFASSNEAVGTLLALAKAPGATTVQIGGNNVDIALSSQSITTIAQNIDALNGISASVVSETVDGETRYRIDISGTTSFTDTDNVLQTLGILKGEYGTVAEAHSQESAVNTDGDASTAITAATELFNIWSNGAASSVQDGDTITIQGTRGDGTRVGTEGNDYKITFTYGAGNDGTTIQDLLDKINNNIDGFGAGSRTATASVSDGKIVITDGTAGNSQLSLTLIANNEGDGTLDFGEISMSTEGRSMQVAAGEDAEIVVDNMTITSSSNTIDDVIEGVTLSLAGEEADTTVTLKIERDLATIKSKIHGMANAYNTIMGYINAQFSYDDENEEVGGVLFGDGTLSSVKSELINTVTRTIAGVSSDFNRLPLIGVSLKLANTDEGKYEDLNMTVDDEALTDALETNFDDVRKLFIAYGSSPSSYLQYISHTTDTEAGTYDVDITQAATRTTFTGKTAVGGGGLTAGDTITITDYETGRVATVTLKSGDSIEGVVNAFNSEFTEDYTEQLQGNKDTGYSSSTLFSDIGGADDEDVITFGGMKRNGIHVSGSYKIGDATTETIGDLLESIEDVFENEVTASLDGNGKLIITDKQGGDSQLSFSIDTSAIDGLDFGTVSTTTEGRYAMGITASKGTGADANKLLLTHNTYGTGHGIMVSHTNEENDPLGLNGVSQVWGKDVAGTINGVTAAGSGQTLSVESDGNNADGLSVIYTGTTTTTTTFTLTLGIAELLDRQLGFITDSTDGYVAYKQTSLENSIDSYETRAEEMEDQLDRKMEMMINKFVAMEVALSKIQNQSDWLIGQINASWNAWG